MSDDRLRARIEAARDARGDLSPPWARHPDYTRYSLGWRMGSGEDWLILFWTWLEEVPVDARRAFLQRHPRAPRTWAGIVQQILDPEASSDIDDEGTEALVQAGLVGDDVAYGAWCLQADGAPERPWKQETPAAAARYGTRRFAFWSRWCVGERAAGWGERWPYEAPPEPWVGLIDAAISGRAPVQCPETDEGWARLAMELVLGAVPPVPWALDVPASAWADTWDLEAGYADAWMGWVWCVFDDEPTFRAYLALNPTPPPAWQALLDTQIII